MKKTVVILTFIGSFLSCSKDKIDRYESFEKLKTSLNKNEFIAWSVDIPKGTKVSYQDNKISITLPKKVEMLFFSVKNNRFEPIASADYTCTCETKDGTCKPFVAGDKIGCTTERNQSCTQCVGTKKGMNELSAQSVVYYVHKIGKSDMGLLDGFTSIQSISNPAFLRTLPPVTPEVLAKPSIDSALTEIVNHYHYPSYMNFSGANIPEGYSLVPISIENRLAYILIPKNKVEPGMIEIAPLTSSSMEEISCSGCNGKCTLKTAKFGQIKYCDGCDSGCTIRNY